MSERSAPRVSVRPYPLKKAIPFVREIHRRLPVIQGGMWSVAATISGEIVGVIIVGHPQARMSDDGVTLEVTRCAVRDGAKNACSALYAAVARAARAMGIGPTAGGEWARATRQRRPVVDASPKVKWAVPWGRLACAP